MGSATLPLDALSEPAARLDPEGRSVVFNRAWSAAYGDQVDWVLDPGCALAGPGTSDGDREVLLAALGRLRSGDLDRFEHLVLAEREDGPYSVRVELVALGAGDCLVRHADQEHGTAALDQWRRTWALELAGIGAWELDPRNGSLWWSDEVYRLHEIDPPRPITVDEAIEYYAPEARDVIQAAVDEGLRNGTPWDEYLPFVTAKGREIWVHALGHVELVDGEPRRLFGVFRDVTDERTAELRLQESEARLAHVIRGSNDGYWDWVVGTDTVWYSPRFVELLGYEPGEVEPTMDLFNERIHPDDSDATWAAINAHLDHGTPYDVEYRLRHRDGSYRWCWSRGHASRNDRGEPIRMSGITTDVTGTRHAREALEHARIAAEEGSRAKSAFLANMSHEIRTPMTAILGFTDLLSRAELTDAERATQIETIRRNGEHLLTILNDILDLSKIEAGRMEIERIDVSPLDVVGDVRDLMQARADEKGLPLLLETPVPLPRTFASDPLRLRQVLNNLVGNAIKFTTAGQVRLRVTFDREAGELHFDVIDTGIGIGADQLERLFEPFTQADTTTTRRFGGSGLGLAISKRLAEALGGDIQVCSESGAGSVFRLVAPVGPLEAADLVAPPASPSKGADEVRAALPSPGDRALAGARILLAEDGPDNQRLINHFLTRAGADVTIVDDGRRAVATALAPAADFDVILMDMQMPELDGYGAAGELRERRCTTPIVALTAHAMSGDRERCLAAGCDEYLTKPVDPDALIAVCAEMADRGRRQRT